MQNKTEMQTEELVQLVSFQLGREQFGIDILKVQEINRMAEITKLPEAPEYCEGLMNLRGKVIPVLNLRRKLELESKEWDKNTRIIVCAVDSHVVGMVVDAVSDVYNITTENINSAPEVGGSVNMEFIKGLATINNEMIILLDVDELINVGVLEEIQQK